VSLRAEVSPRILIKIHSLLSHASAPRRFNKRPLQPRKLSHEPLPQFVGMLQLAMIQVPEWKSFWAAAAVKMLLILWDLLRMFRALTAQATVKNSGVFVQDIQEKILNTGGFSRSLSICLSCVAIFLCALVFYTNSKIKSTVTTALKQISEMRYDEARTAGVSNETPAKL
jgi:hypothetical protein